MLTTDQKLFDAVLSNALDILRLSAHERQLMVRRLAGLQKELLRRLGEETLSAISRAQIEKVIDDADLIIDHAYHSFQLELNLRGIAEMSADHVAHGMSIALGEDAIAVPSAPYFASLNSDVLIQGAPSADWWRGQSKSVKVNFGAEVRKGAANGETNQQIVTRIVGKSGQSGVMDIARNDATALVNTSVQTVANDARRKTFQANGDIIKGIEQVSTLDGHTTLICIAYSECQWDLNFKPIGEKQLPYNGGTPRHWNCRSVEVPLTVTFRDLGLNIDEPPGSTRASSSGQVPINTSFDDYLKRMGVDYQNKVLGPGRADLWRQGKITLKDLVNGRGRPVSLEELHSLVRKRTAGK